jgi:DNA (cytosine-5)-methyltransferase 1
LIKRAVPTVSTSCEHGETLLEQSVDNLRLSTPLAYPPKNSFTFIDLFCGAGGFSEGFLLAGTSNTGFKLIAASDINPMTQKTYEFRFRVQLGLDFEFILQDAQEASFTENIITAVKRQTGQDSIDVVCGGPPCQGFSLFGARKEDDPRNKLILSYLNTIEVLQPRYFVIENVPGLVKMYGGKVVENIFQAVDAMKPIKYKLYGPILLNAANYGVPQLRERVLFIGCREDMPSIQSIPPQLLPDEYVSAGSAIGDLGFLQPWMTATSYHEKFPAVTQYQAESRRGRLFKKLGIERTDMALYNHEAAKHTPDVLARFSMIQKGLGLESIPRELWEKHLSTKKNGVFGLMMADHPIQ